MESNQRDGPMSHKNNNHLVALFYTQDVNLNTPAALLINYQLNIHYYYSIK